MFYYVDILLLMEILMSKLCKMFKEVNLFFLRKNGE